MWQLHWMPSDNLGTILRHQQGFAFKIWNWTIMVMYPARTENKAFLNYTVRKGSAEWKGKRKAWTKVMGRKRFFYYFPSMSPSFLNYNNSVAQWAIPGFCVIKLTNLCSVLIITQYTEWNQIQRQWFKLVLGMTRYFATVLNLNSITDRLQKNGKYIWEISGRFEVLEYLC